MKRSSLRTLVILALLALLHSPNRASAQTSIWGHPVITLGQTPYYATSTGHGNYPGSDGFIPGYGYYPGSLPGHYPWLDGPETPFDRRKIAPFFPGDGLAFPPSVEMLRPPGAAVVIVKVPAEAELWFDGARTAQGGSYRTFVTPPLPKGQSLSYSLRAVWRIKDAELTRVEEVRVAPGSAVTVNFLTTDSWTGRRIVQAPADTVGPMPRSLPPSKPNP